MSAGRSPAGPRHAVYVSGEDADGEPGGWHWRPDCPDYPVRPAVAQLTRPAGPLCASCWRLAQMDERFAGRTGEGASPHRSRVDRVAGLMRRSRTQPSR